MTYMHMIIEGANVLNLVACTEGDGDDSGEHLRGVLIIGGGLTVTSITAAVVGFVVTSLQGGVVCREFGQAHAHNVT